MGLVTKIQWCDSTDNPSMGCDGCELWNRKTGVRKCYAGNMTTRFGGHNKGYPPSFEEVTLYPGRMAQAAMWTDLRGKQRLNKPWLDGRDRHIFVSDMGDSLSEAVSFEYLNFEIIDNVVSAEGSRHVWQWLTKRPERMAQFSDWLEEQGLSWPINLWAGTSITTSPTLGRVSSLLKVGDSGTRHFLSVEPQRESIDLRPWLPQLDWVIQGGQSGTDEHPFDVNWARDILEQCREHNCTYFLKQLGAVAVEHGRRVHLIDGHGGDWSEWAPELQVRDMPPMDGGKKGTADY